MYQYNNQIYGTIEDVRQSNTNISIPITPTDDQLTALGITIVSATVPTKEEQLTTLDDEYQPQFDSLIQALGAAMLNDDTDLQADIKADYAAIKLEYADKREVIING
jgi:hypothetical protein